MSLTVENLSFSYEKHEVLHEISFTAQAGELLAILGPNGVGKTTLFKCVMGLERRYTGKILADGVDLSALSPRERAHRVAAIPQAHPLSFRYSAFDMVLMGTSHTLSPFNLPGEKERAAARAAMERVNISHLAERPFDHLSGGEQQRIAIARAIVNSPSLVIADEPTGNLDPETSMEIMEIFQEINNTGTTIIMATHDKEIVDAMGKRVIAIEHGEIVRDELNGVYGYESEQ